MKRYFLKIKATGMIDNPNYAGENNEYIYGKNEQMLMVKSRYLNYRLADSMFLKYGYKRKSDVKRSIMYKLLGTERYWNEEAEIIEMEFEEK